MAYWHSGILALRIGNTASYILGRKSSSVDTDNLTRCWQRREIFQLSPLLIQYKPLHMLEANITIIYLSAPSASPSMLSPHTPTLTTFDRCPLHNTNNIIHHIPYLVPTPSLTFSHLHIPFGFCIASHCDHDEKNDVASTCRYFLIFSC